MAERMCRTLRRRSCTIAWTLLLAFVAVLSATCIATAETSPAQHACCESMAADCGTSMAQEHTCCPTETVRLDQQTVAADRVGLSAPGPISVTMLAALPMSAGVSSTPGDSTPELRPPLRGGPAPHLRRSILRI
jgi:hypothetical protein